MNGIYRSATLKLTAWYLVLVMAISLVFSGVVFHFAHDELSWGLRNQTVRIYREFPVISDNPFFVKNDDLTLSSRRILLNLFYFNVIVLVAAGFASYWLARRTLEPIEASNERQKRFVGDASHELRTPVTALKMDAEVALMDEAATKDQLRQTLQSNLEEANKLEALLNNLLRLSQLETTDLQQSFAPVSTSSVIDAAIGQTKPQAHAKHIDISNTTSDATVIGDHDSLAQLLVILIDNAIKYSPEKSTITISSKQNDHETTVTVADQGIGITQEALEHVFDRFYRADTSRTGTNGYGLGLAIAKGIADLHNGTITLKSAHGKGTRASLTLPTLNDN